MNRISISEFKPTIFFLLKFIGLYFVANLLYGMYISSTAPGPDSVTNYVTTQTSQLLNGLGWNTSYYQDSIAPTTHIVRNNRNIISVYEGCNGINVMIIFVAFILAFGPLSKHIIWFLLLGLLVIHLSNLLRLMLLFMVSIEFPRYLYFTHKYVFTAVIYLIVFALWVWWVQVFRVSHKSKYEK